jgi:hypothetical protein
VVVEMVLELKEIPMLVALGLMGEQQLSQVQQVLLVVKQVQ